MNCIVLFQASEEDQGQELQARALRSMDQNQELQKVEKVKSHMDLVGLISRQD